MRRIFGAFRSVRLNVAAVKVKKSWKIYGAIGVTAATAAGIYLYKNPEKIFSKSVENKFDYALGYSAKKKIYQLVPTPQIPDFSLPTDKKLLTHDEWARLVSNTIKDLNRSYLVKTINYMRETLMEYILNEIPDLELRLKELRVILPNSLELYLVVEAQLQDELKKTGALDGWLLEKNIIESRTAYSINAKLLEVALLSYPGGRDECFALMQGHVAIEEFMKKIPNAPLVEESLVTMKEEFQRLHPQIQKDIMERVVNQMIQIANKTEEGKVLFRSILNKHIFQKLGGDSLIKPMLGDIIAIFNALPTRLQSKILIGTLQQRNNLNHLRHMLNNTGIVAIKLGQILAEDPKLPANYRDMLSGLRDSNDPMGLTEFWNSIPNSIRCDIKKLGPLLGVGSVKQVHSIEMVDSSQKVIAVIRKNIEDDAVATIKALRSIKKVDGLVNRIEKLMFSEMDLWLEYAAFEHLRGSSFGKESFIIIPRVEVNTLNCLIRERAHGDTLAKILKHQFVFDALPYKGKILGHISRLHKTAIAAAIDEGFIMSDLHFGNIVYDHEKDKLVLFDPGQNDTLSKEQSKALLWTLVSLTDKKRMRQLKNSVLKELKIVAGTRLGEEEVKRKIALAFDSCVELPDLRSRFFQLLIATEREGVILPNGFFAAAKLFDTLQSQEQLLKLPSQVETEIGRLFWKNISTTEKGIFLLKSIT
ncbi:MAG: hypothetical protein Harvfovirus39_14 [Harvfovirus sp.]|uniref:ABC1 atypical kinase-like domain-containing protein n=1 Tax=Harvfovirus sp. TaxID=2487768 RepID=A0A3G5A2V8_9VIRU|nr:MAG: hypothetical protein Harvfovirus39_14 [Harvfovirus sp.]